MPEPTPIEFPPHRTLCSLAEAAKIAGCSSVELLRSAARDVLRLCVRVPSGIAVLSVDMSVLPGGRYEKASLLTLVRAGVENSPVTAASIVKDISLLFWTALLVKKLALWVMRQGRYFHQGECLTLRLT